MNYSPLQEEIFDFVEHGDSNAIISAVAGSGKTTTIVEAYRRVPADKTCVFLAFNKDIAKELAGRGLNALTFHSLCWKSLANSNRNRKLDGGKLRKICADWLIPGHYEPANDDKLYISFICKLVGLAKNAGCGTHIQPDTVDFWCDLADRHDLSPENEKCSFSRGIALARELLARSNKSTTMVDFDDMLYLTVLEGVSLPKFDVVFVDEAQDTNAIQREILRKIMRNQPHRYSRLIAVGDPQQAIYGFRGADNDSLEILQAEFEPCNRFPLSISYRCARSIVEYAQAFSPAIEYAETAALGEVKSLVDGWNTTDFTGSDLVVCRKNAPLLALAMRLLRDRIPCTVLGRDIGEGLKSLIEKQKAASIDALNVKLTKWADREIAKVREDEAKVEAIEDKLMAIQAILEDCDTVEQVLAVIERLFTAKNGVTLSTIHKSKGLEAERVFWLNREDCPLKSARQSWQMQQEFNLMYVAATRAKSTLYFLSMGDL